MRPAWRDLPFGAALRQPDQRSCGAACLVVARMVLDDGYAQLTVPEFGTEVLATHRALTGTSGPTGGAQIPWPRALGTPPWALARRMAFTGVPVRWRPARLSPRPAYDRLLADVRTGLPVPIYVGSAWLPRHVVLALAADEEAGTIEVYDPACGRLTEITATAFGGRRLGPSGWDVPWFVLGRRPS